MHVYDSNHGLFVRLDAGEEIITTLGALAADRDIPGAVFSGIGAVHRTTLGYFELGKREYLRREFPDEMELVTCHGNLTWVDGAPLIHAHATIAGADYVAHAGHLFSAEIAVTGEFFFHATDLRLGRSLDARTGLKLIE